MDRTSRQYSYPLENDVVKVKVSCGGLDGENKVGEYHVMLTVEEPVGKFEEQFSAVRQALTDWLQDTGRCRDRILFRRYFLSDIANQEKILLEKMNSDQREAVSLVQQPPVNGTKLALWVYLQGKRKEEEKDISYRHYWFVNGHLTGIDARKQMAGLFECYRKNLQEKACDVKGNCVRTWLFVRDIDVNYPDVVKGRKDFFYAHGLTEATHFIASTGIEGYAAESQSAVSMDAYAVAGLQPSQFYYLKGLTHLNPTWEYGVTFERGVSVRYGDRRQAYISGTASIDNKGQIVSEGDITGQVNRMWENVEVLLAEDNYVWDDVAQMIVYIRDPGDAREVAEMFEQRFPDVPKVLVRASICRPAWLVEMECIAIKEQVCPEFENF